jgi:hypothetical protein
MDNSNQELQIHKFLRNKASLITTTSTTRLPILSTTIPTLHLIYHLLHLMVHDTPLRITGPGLHPQIDQVLSVVQCLVPLHHLQWNMVHHRIHHQGSKLNEVQDTIL